MIRFSYVTIIIMSLAAWVLAGCGEKGVNREYRPSVVASSEIIADAAKSIGGEFIVLHKISLANAAHYAFAPAEKEMAEAASADVIFFNGLYPEERLPKILQKTGLMKWKLKPVYLSSGVRMDGLVQSGNGYNPHFFTDPKLWEQAVSFITDNLVRVSPENERIYRRNEEQLLMRLAELDKYIAEKTALIPEEKRILVTLGNDFQYFAKRYGFLNASLTSDPGGENITAANLEKLSDFIIENNVKTVFTEYGAPKRHIKTLIRGLAARGYKVADGGVLYSHKMGGADYIKMMIDNTDTITKALTEESI